MRVRDAAAIALALVAGLACARPSIPPPPAGESAAAPPPSTARPRSATPSRSVAPSPPAAPAGPAPLARAFEPPPAATAAPLPPVAPAEIRFTDLAGVRRELDALRARGRPVLVNFWATWCGACVQELPALGDLAREWGDDGPAIVGVSLDHLTVPDDERVMGRVRPMLATHRVAYPNRIVRGDQQEVFDAFGIPGGIPFSLFYDGRGAIVRRFTGTVAVEDARGIARSLAAGR